MSQWLEGRYQPQGRPQPWQTDRRWGNLGDEPPAFTWGDVVAGRAHRFNPRRRQDYTELAKGASAVGGAAGAGWGAGQFGIDTLYYGEPWQTAGWRALIGPNLGAGPPPAWWPQPPVEQRPPPAGPQPQPASRSSTPWVR
jgi:hypothetical protein